MHSMSKVETVDLMIPSILIRARRNAQGHLEPDASDEVVQASQGFGNYEMAPKAEDRKSSS